MRNFRTANYNAPLADTNSFEQWTKDGALDMEKRANARWKTMLEDYKAPELDADIDRALQEFIEQRKASMPDAWY